MFTLNFWRTAGERATKTFLQVFAAAVLLGEPGTSVFNIDWRGGFGFAAAATLMSLVTSVVSLPFGPGATASVVVDQSEPPAH